MPGPYFDAILGLTPATFIPFDEADGVGDSTPTFDGTLYDYTGFGPDLIGTLQYGEAGIIPSQPDTSFRFGGATDFAWMTPLFTDPDMVEWPSFVPFSAVMRIAFQSAAHQTVIQEYASPSFRMYVRKDAAGHIVFGWLGTSTLWREVTSSVTLTTGTAYTVGVVMARPTTTSMSLTIYVDGVSVATQTWTSESPMGLNYEILLNTANSSAVDPSPLDATVAGVATWGSALTGADMLALHESAATVPPTYAEEVLADTPAVYYRLGESGAGSVIDSSGNGRTASYPFVTPTLGEPGLIDDADTCALFSGASFGGAQTTSGVIPNTTTLTVEFWMKTSTKALKSIVARDHSTAGNKVWLVRTNGSGRIFFSNPVTGTSSVGTADVCDGAVHHIVVTVNGLNHKIYVDGALDATNTDFGNLRTTVSTGVYIGGDAAGSAAYQGHLDEVAVYGTELSAARILDHYTTGVGAAAPSTDLTIANVDFSGSGTFAAATPTNLTIASVAFSGSGTLSATTPVPITFSGDGTLAIGGTELYIPPELTLEILDDALDQAPTPITVVLVEGFPEMAVEFRIDGVLVWTGMTDSDGYLAPTSINVPEELGAAGEHTLTATQPGAGIGTATFTMRRDPALNPSTMGPDAQAVDVPGAVRANGTRRWVFQDLMPDGLGSWIMPKNPAEGPMPYSDRQFTTKVTTTGQPHVTEGMRVPVDWQFSGIALDEEFAEKLLAYRNLNRRFYIINHRGQAFKVIVTDVALTPRLRKSFGDNEDYLESQYIDGNDYTVTATVLDQDWVVPA